MARKKKIEDNLESPIEISADFNEVFEKYYVDYAMSVITDRALPDVRDNMKPVQRRILYDMYSYLNLTHDKPYKKCARIVGDTMGRLHVHGRLYGHIT